MQRLALICCAIVLAACTKSENRAADESAAMDTAAAAPATPAAPTISLADMGGTWKVTTTDDAGGNVVETQLVATADTYGWTMTAAKRKPIPVRVVAVAGNSVVTEAGPYVRREAARIVSWFDAIQT